MPDLICFHCQKAVSYIGKIGRRDECHACKSDLHACKNCHFYDPVAYNQCREPSADVVQEKDRSNFCDYFQPRIGGLGGRSSTDLKAAAEALFKKKDG